MYARIMVLRFPSEITDKPIVCNLSREFDLCFNILKAEILPGEEGIMVIEISGQKKHVSAGLKYLKAQGVKIKSVAQEVRRNDEVCIHCGACTGICPRGAFSIHPDTREVIFDPKRCKGCGLCVMVCPVRAMEIRFAKEKAII